MRKAKCLSISLDQLVDLMSDGLWFRCVSGIPKGASVIGASYDLLSNCVQIIIHHETFADVRQGEHAPYFYPEYQVTNSEVVR